MGSLTEYFIPDNFTDERNLERRRGEIAVRTVFILFPCGLVATAFIYWLFGAWLMTLGMAFLPLCLGIAPFVLRGTGSIELSSAFILVPLYGVVVWYAVSTGGLFAPSVSILLLVPPLAIVYLGMRAAGIWLVIVVLTWAAMFGAEMMGYNGVVHFDPERYPVRRMTELMILAATVSGLFYLKDSLQSWLVARVQKKEAETRAVVETAPDGILTVDLDGIIETANEAAAKIFGRGQHELVGNNIRNLISSLEAAGFDRRRRFDVTEQHQGWRGEEEFPIEIAFGLIEGGDSDESRVVLVLRDITDRKDAERQLRRARDEALEASRAKSTFLANMSHELRTPLNGVIGYSEIMLEEIDFLRDEEPQKFEAIQQFVPDIEHIHTAGEHLLALINDILDLSKIEAGQMQVHVESFDVEELIDNIAQTVRPLADTNDNEFEIDVPRDLDEMHSDSTKVRQILFNLLSNACKFTEQGSIWLTVENDVDTLAFVVEDTGIGMSEDEVDEMFEAFHQADSSTTRKFGGTGLGLTITSHFCTLLDGEIDVDSSLGEGTKFVVRLARDLRPDVDPDLDSIGEYSSEQIENAEIQNGGVESVDTVVVVDDDETIRQLMTRILEPEGYRVVTAANGTEGLLLASKVDPEVIIVDVMMPSMDGWSLLTKLRDDPKTADIPVIIQSMLAEQERGYALGADHYLVKPVDRRKLIDILNEYRQLDGDVVDTPIP